MGTRSHLNIRRGNDYVNQSHLANAPLTTPRRWALRAVATLLLGGVLVGVPSATGSASTLAGTARPSVMKTCPSAAAASRAAGTSLPAPKVTRLSGMLFCSYNNSVTYTNLVIELSPSSFTSPAMLKAMQQKKAASQKVALKSAPGYGSVAYYYTNSYESANGIPATSFAMIAGPELVMIELNRTISHVEAVARLILMG